MDISNPESGKAKGQKQFQLEHTLSFDILLYWNFYEQNNNFFKISWKEKKCKNPSENSQVRLSRDSHEKK